MNLCCKSNFMAEISHYLEGHNNVTYCVCVLMLFDAIHIHISHKTPCCAEILDQNIELEICLHFPLIWPTQHNVVVLIHYSIALKYTNLQV